MLPTKHPLWARYLVHAAIEYFNNRAVKVCLLIDNTILKDGVLEAQNPNGSSEFIVCVAPGYTTQMDYGDQDLTISIRFAHLIHTLTIPYEAIRAVLGADTGGVLTDDGHINIIEVPPVIYPPGAPYRRRSTDPKPAESLMIDEIQAQPRQFELRLVGHRG